MDGKGARRLFKQLRSGTVSTEIADQLAENIKRMITDGAGNVCYHLIGTNETTFRQVHRTARQKTCEMACC